MQAIKIAEYIIDKAYKNKSPISNFQLQIILYYIQIEFLQKFGKTCFEDPIEAWKFGPAIKEVYNRYCHYGALKITRTYDTLPGYKENELELIDKIIDEKTQIKASELIRETHKGLSPWKKVFGSGQGYKEKIPLDILRIYG